MRLNLRCLNSPVFFYTLKCLVALSVGYWFFTRFPNHEFYWTLISLLLVMAPDSKDSVKLSFDRMKANTIGSITGLILFVMPRPVFFLLSLGVIITITICSILKLMNVGRTALAAMLIVMIHEKNGNNWEVALERMGCVILGCIIALVVSFIFGLFEKKYLTGGINKNLE